MRFRYINILREIIENNFPFPQNLGVQRRPFFVLGGRLDALLAKSLPINPKLIGTIPKLAQAVQSHMFIVT